MTFYKKAESHTLQFILQYNTMKTQLLREHEAELGSTILDVDPQ